VVTFGLDSFPEWLRPAGLLRTLSTIPVAATTDQILVIATVQGPSRLHYVVQEINNRTISVEPLEHSVIVTSSDSSIVQRGRIDISRTNVVEINVTGLHPNTSYIVQAVTETIGQIESVPTGVYSSVVQTNTTTHAIAPFILKATAGASVNATDSILLTANLSSPGIVHYSLSDVEFTDPLVLQTPVDQSRQPHTVRGLFVVQPVIL
jgi:hypothetical protein